MSTACDQRGVTYYKPEPVASTFGKSRSKHSTDQLQGATYRAPHHIMIANQQNLMDCSILKEIEIRLRQSRCTQQSTGSDVIH